MNTRELSYNAAAKALSALLLFLCVSAYAQSAPESDEQSMRLSRAIDADRALRTPAQRKISEGLLLAIRALNGKRDENVVPGAPELRAPPLETLHKGLISVDVVGNLTPDLENFIKSQRGKVTVSLPEYRAFTLKIPVEMVEALAERPEINSIKETTVATPQQSPLPDSSKIDMEGAIAHAADAARTAYKTTGSGIKVCVISSSVRYLQQAQANHSLPSDVEVLPGQDGLGCDGVDTNKKPFINPGEGTAMLEIVHRIAPGATLAFATGVCGENSMAKNIQDLVKVKCNIIVNDISYWDEPPFQDGIISQEVEAASAKGVLYVSSAGNDFHAALPGGLPTLANVWQGEFVAVPEAPWYHQFSKVPGQDPKFNEMWAVPYRIVLSWNDPLQFWKPGSDPAKRNHYRAIVFDAAGKMINAGTESVDRPMSSLTLEPPLKQYEHANLAIFQSEGSASRYLRITATGGLVGGQLKFGTNGMTFGNNAAKSALTVGAVSAKDAKVPFTDPTISGQVELFSSDGPRQMFYLQDGTPIDVLVLKPDVIAADGVTTDVPGWPDSKNAFAPFNGTSAAAPHVAAISALLMSYKPSLTVPQIKYFIKSGASVSNILDGKGLSEVATAPLFGHGISMPGSSLEQASKVPLEYDKWYNINSNFGGAFKVGPLSLEGRNMPLSWCQDADYCVATGASTRANTAWKLKLLDPNRTTDNFVRDGDLIKIITTTPPDWNGIGADLFLGLYSSTGCNTDYYCVAASVDPKRGRGGGGQQHLEDKESVAFRGADGSDFNV